MNHFEYIKNMWAALYDQKQDIKDNISIRPTEISDIENIVKLSYQKRLAYEKAQPQFWKYAGPEAEESQAQWFTELLANDKYIMLTALQDKKIMGFIIGKLIPAPEVYDPGGLTLMIDDFCVSAENLWPTVGAKLIESIKPKALSKGAAQILVVCGAHDSSKRQFLKDQNLNLASEWFVREIS